MAYFLDLQFWKVRSAYYIWCRWSDGWTPVLLPLALIEAGTSPTLGIDPCVWRQLGGTCPGCSLGTSGHAQVLFRPLLPPLLHCLSPGASSLLAGRPPFPRITAPSSPRQAEQTQCGLERRPERRSDQLLATPARCSECGGTFNRSQEP